MGFRVRGLGYRVRLGSLEVRASILGFLGFGASGLGLRARCCLQDRGT